MTVATSNISIRLSTQNAEAVKAALEQLRRNGLAVLKTIELTAARADASGGPIAFCAAGAVTYVAAWRAKPETDLIGLITDRLAARGARAREASSRSNFKPGKPAG
jgi:hypothetical protein